MKHPVLIQSLDRRFQERKHFADRGRGLDVWRILNQVREKVGVKMLIGFNLLRGL